MLEQKVITFKWCRLGGKLHSDWQTFLGVISIKISIPGNFIRMLSTLDDLLGDFCVFCVFWILLMSGCHLEMDLWWSLCFLDGLCSFKQSAVWPDVGIKIAQFFQKLSIYWPQQFLLKICCPGFKAYAHYLRFYHL